MKEIGPETAFYAVAIIIMAMLGAFGLILLTTGGVQV